MNFNTILDLLNILRSHKLEKKQPTYIFSEILEYFNKLECGAVQQQEDNVGSKFISWWEREENNENIKQVRLQMWNLLHKQQPSCKIILIQVKLLWQACMEMILASSVDAIAKNITHSLTDSSNQVGNSQGSIFNIYIFLV